MDKSERNSWRDSPLYKESRTVCDYVHELLKGPEGEDEINGDYEMQRINLSLPKAFVELATYIAIRENEPSRDPSFFWKHYLNGSEDFKKSAIRLRNSYLARVLFENGHEDLHWLCIGGHSALYPEERLVNKTPDEGMEKRWQRQKAVRLLRHALIVLADGNQSDLEDYLDEQSEYEEAPLVRTVLELADQALRKKLDRSQGGGNDLFDDDIPF